MEEKFWVLFHYMMFAHQATKPAPYINCYGETYEWVEVTEEAYDQMFQQEYYDRLERGY